MKEKFGALTRDELNRSKTYSSSRFGEDSVEKMVDWAQDYIPKDPTPSILEVGAGNGALLFALQEAGYDGKKIVGVDYSEDAVKLAHAVGSSRGEGCEDVKFEVCDFLVALPAGLDGSENGVWDLVLDKGTFDAIALGEKDVGGRSPADGYPSRIGQIVKPGGFFLITCAFVVRSSRGCGSTKQLAISRRTN
jgi:EEF1A lysine methyltransferase 2